MIGLHQKDKAILERIQSILGVGSITKHGMNSIQYRIHSIKNLAIIIDHFDKYPLITQKRADYILFKQVFELVKRKEHRKPEGLQKIVNLKVSSNLGLSDELKVAFPNTIPAPRPVIVDQVIKDPNWLAQGFVSGEGCFFIFISKSSTSKSGFRVRLRFDIAQHSRDVELMKSLKEYLG